MKTPILCAFLLGATQLTTFQEKSTPPPLISQAKTGPATFSYLRGHKSGKGHSLQWSMVSNSGVESFQVQSTYEDPYDAYSNWQTIGNVPNSKLNIFKFTDQAPMTGIINYRVIAELSGNDETVVSE